MSCPGIFFSLIGTVKLVMGDPQLYIRYLSDKVRGSNDDRVYGYLGESPTRYILNEGYLSPPEAIKTLQMIRAFR
jgi:hypothetical protein